MCFILGIKAGDHGFEVLMNYNSWGTTKVWTNPLHKCSNNQLHKGLKTSRVDWPHPDSEQSRNGESSQSVHARSWWQSGHAKSVEYEANFASVPIAEKTLQCCFLSTGFLRSSCSTALSVFQAFSALLCSLQKPRSFRNILQVWKENVSSRILIWLFSLWCFFFFFKDAELQDESDMGKDENDSTFGTTLSLQLLP